MWPFKSKQKRLDSGRHDGWSSALTGFGQLGTDKRTSLGFEIDPVSDIEAREMWRGNDICKRVVELVPRECMRQGFSVKTEDKKSSELLMAKLKELRAPAAIVKAKQWERAYGGSAIFPVINDGVEDLSIPLNLKRIPEVEHLQVFEPRELHPITFYRDPREPKFGLPEKYRLVPISRGGATLNVDIHESRLVVFPGVMVSRSQLVGTRAGWGDSVFTNMKAALRDFDAAWSGASVLLQDFAQAVFKIRGLAELIAMDKDDIVKNRLRAVELSRSVMRAILIDAEGEEFERKQTPIGGLPEMLDRFSTRLAAACDMPLTLLMGQSPAGMNATGESDIRFFYDRVSGEQTSGIQPQLEYLIQLIFLSNDGPTKGVEPDLWSIDWHPLWQASDKEKADARLAQAQTDDIYIKNGTLDASEVAVQRFGGDAYSFDTHVDMEARQALEPNPVQMMPKGQLPPVDDQQVNAPPINGRVKNSLSPVDPTKSPNNGRPNLNPLQKEPKA